MRPASVRINYEPTSAPATPPQLHDLMASRPATTFPTDATFPAPSTAPTFPVAPAPVSRPAISLREQPWLGSRVPNGYWDDRENRVAYITWLGEQCGFLKAEDWYSVRKHHFQRNHGGGLLRNEYGSSVLAAMMDYLPSYDWKPWLFGGAPNGFWKSRENRCWFMDWLGQELGFTTTEDWYSVTGADFFEHHGGGLLNNQFNGSVQALLIDYKPDFEWKAWRFTSVPQSYWRSAENRRNYLLWLGEQLGFRTARDWRKLRRDDFYKNEGSGLFVTHYHGSTQQALAELFSEPVPA